jgi:hypothetical protein
MKLYRLEQTISVEKFSEYFCDDFFLQHNIYVPIISRSIQSQLEEFRKFYLYSDIPVSPDTRAIIRVSVFHSCKLDITVGKVQLRDRFEWDLASGLSPEVFASMLAADLQLGGEFVSLIAHRFYIFF